MPMLQSQTPTFAWAAVHTEALPSVGDRIIATTVPVSPNVAVGGMKQGMP